MEINTSTTSGKIAVLQGFERGERVELSYKCMAQEPGWEWSVLGGNFTSDNFNFENFIYRLKPLDPYDALKAAFARGEVIQYRDPTWESESWRLVNGATHLEGVIQCVEKRGYSWRIKPTPKRVPLEAMDVPAPVCWIRSIIFREGCALVIGISHERVTLSGGWESMRANDPARILAGVSFEELANGFEYSTDRKEWKECSKPEEAK